LSIYNISGTFVKYDPDRSLTDQTEDIPDTDVA